MTHLVKKVINLISILYCQIKYRCIMFRFGWKSRIIQPMLIANAKNISIGKNVLIRNGIRLEVVDAQNKVVIKIGDNVNIEQYVHIVGRCSIEIGDNVSITGGCSIVDVIHPYEDITLGTKIGDRILQEPRPVSIGNGSFLGCGVHVSPGVKIGKYCVIGARSVVTKNIADYCVAVGNPAKVIKQYNFEKHKWESVQ